MAKPCWTCGTCTLLNPATKRRCQVCNSRKPVVPGRFEQQKPRHANTNIAASTTDTSSSNDKTASTAAESIPRFQLSSTATIAIAVTTTASGGTNNNYSNCKEILAEGLIAAIGTTITDNNNNKVVPTKVSTTTTATTTCTTSRKRARPPSPPPRHQRKSRPLPASSVSFHDCNAENNTPSGANVGGSCPIEKGVESNNSMKAADDRNEEYAARDMYVVDTTCTATTNAMTRNSAIYEETEETTIRLQPIENTTTNIGTNNGDIGSTGENKKNMMTIDDHHHHKEFSHAADHENTVDATATKQQDNSPDEVEPEQFYDAREEQQQPLTSSAAMIEPSSLVAKRAIPFRSNTKNTNKNTEKTTERRTPSKEPSPVLEKEYTVMETIEDNRRINQHPNDQSDATETIQRKLTTTAATTAMTTTAIAVNTEAPEEDHMTTVSLISSFPRPFDATCDGRITDFISTVDVEASTSTSASVMLTKNAAVTTEIQHSESAQEAQQREVDGPCARTSGDSSSTRKNNNDKEEEDDYLLSSQPQSEYDESQSSFLSRFAYTPPGIGATTTPQSSQKMQVSSEERETNNADEAVALALAKTARLQTSRDFCEQQHQECKQQQQENQCEHNNSSPPSSDNQYSSLLSSSSHPPQVKESDCLAQPNTVVTNDLTTVDAAASNLRECVKQHSLVNSFCNDIIAPTSTFATAGSNSIVAVLKESLERAADLLEQQEIFPNTLSTTLSKPKPSMAVFQTAGTGASIAVSKEKVEEMGRMLNKKSSSSSKQPVVSLKRSSLAMKPSMAMFQTAGSGASIAVSEEKVEAMGRMLNKTSSSSSKQPVVSLKRSSLAMKPSMAMFQTAGSGASIKVSEEKVEAMGRMLNKKSSSSSKESVVSLKRPRLTTKPSVAMFQTAGNGASIAVSVEKVEAMGRMLNKPSLSSKESIVSPKRPSLATKPSMAMFQTAWSGTSVTLSDEDVKDMGRMLNMSPSSFKGGNPSLKMPTPSMKPSMAMFQSAGSGTSIAVSEEKVKEAEQLFSKSPSFSNDQRFSKTRSEVLFSMRTPKISSKTPTHRSVTSVKFASIPITKDSKLAMFKTAGNGVSITVTEKQVADIETILNTSSSSSEYPNSRKTLSEGSVSTGTPANSLQTPRESSDTKMYSAMYRDPSLDMVRHPSSTASKIVPEKKTEEIRQLLDKNASNTNSDLIMTRTEAMLSTRTPMSSFQTPRAVTAMKNDSATLTAIFQTAGTGKTIEASEEKIEEMRVLLEKPSSFSEQLTEEKKRLPQKYTKVTDLADKNPRHRSLTNSDHDFVEANLRSYPHSPLRTNEVKSLNFNRDTVACTPSQETKAITNKQFVGGTSLTRIAFGMTPSSVSKIDSAPSSHVMKDDMIPLQSFLENQEHHDNEIDITLQEQDTHCPPNECKIPSRSTNVTESGDDGLVRKRQVDQSGDVTPVPISFSAKTEMSNVPVTKWNESSPGECSSNSGECQTLKDAIRYGVMSTCPSMCRLNGISEVTMLVDCNNSLQLRFDCDGMPKTYELNEEEQSSNLQGSVSDIRQSLIDKGCDSYRIKDEWIRNHTRWVVWKLASYERCFSRFLAGRYLTYHNLVQNLLSRFQHEIINGIRPAVRKIVNRDVSASKMMILVVCRVISSSETEGGDASPQSTIVELSDGWYSVKGCLDSKISQYVKDGLIKVGTKLLVSSARLVGANDGVDPLDEGDGTGCQNCKATLKLTANATRLARWNAKLGFVNQLNVQRMPHGHLLVKRISDIVPGGGNIPAIRLFIHRLYPMLYYEKCEHTDPCDHNSVSTAKRRVFTEQEEDTRRRSFEIRKLRVMEKLTDRIQGEVEQEVDESAPEVWKRMMSSTTPEETYESFGNDDKCVISRWKEKRSSLIHRRVRDEVESELETETSLIRESTNFLRVKVHSIDPKSFCNESAMLTIWQPTEEQVGCLKEGISVEIHNLAVRESTYEGISQLVANNRTIIEPFAFEASSLAEKIGFRRRRFLNLFQVHTLSHGASNLKGRMEKNVTFDVAAVQIHVQTSKILDDFVFYLSDETNLILRVHCKNPPSILKTLILSEKQSFPTYAMRDLFIRPFDQEQQCAVAEFCDMSSVVLTNNRLEILSQWVASSSQSEIQQIAAYIKEGLPLWEHDRNEKIFLGYVMGLRIERTEKIYVEVDCCGQGSFEWKLPVGILRQMMSAISLEKLEENIFPDKENRAAKVSSLSSIFRARCTLWRFQLSSEPESVVCSATKANKRNIGHLYNTLQH